MWRSLFSKISPGLIVKEATATARAVTEYEQRLLALCKMTADQALQELVTPAGGLTEEDVERRRSTYGANTAGLRQRAGFLLDILRRFYNPLAIQLLIIAGVSAIMDALSNPQGDFSTTAIVGGMVVLSVGLSYVQETRSSRAVEKLRAMVQSSAVVLRGGVELEVPIDALVPGDIILLHAGAIIPADLRLLSAKDFFVSQSALTGESMPVEKTAEPADTQGRSALALPNACFQGSNVLSGTGRGLVVNTGTRTFFGAIAERLAGQRVQTSFDKGLKDFTWLMMRFMVIMVSLVFLIVGLTKHNWFEALLFSLTVSVGLTPEMLPMIVTVNLSKGALMMSRKKVIVKQLPSIQNFGAMDVLCTDKTGTLTQDRVVLERHVDVTGRESEDVLRYAYMNSHYQTGLRNLLDRAVLACTDLDVEHNCRKVDEIPFDFSRRRMSVVVEYGDDNVLVCKGAVEEVYKHCDRYQVDEDIYPLIDIIKHDLIEEVEGLYADGFRVLAIAYREFPKDKQVFSVADESQLVLLGYIAFFDPPKDSTATALASLRAAGVQVKILTGDNALVTKKICKDVGLEIKRLVTGDELQNLSTEALDDLAEEATVFARLDPSQKEQIIQALRRRGHVVGYMGDGINDAPSLRTADVGISVDSGVDVAKEAADIVLLEKNLLVLEDGIIEGRRVFCNIVKYIRMGASSNFGNMFSVLGASYLFKFLPMQPIQILTNNLLYDFSQIGIPTDRVDDEWVAKPRRWNMGGIRRFMLYIGPLSSIFDYATFGLMWWFFGCHAWQAPADGGPTPYLEKLFQTGWFVESLLTQTLIVYIIRTRRIPFLQSSPSPAMLITTLVVVAVGSWLPYSPMAPMLGLVPLPWKYWLWIGGFMLAYSILTHNVKVWFFKRFGMD